MSFSLKAAVAGAGAAEVAELDVVSVVGAVADQWAVWEAAAFEAVRSEAVDLAAVVPAECAVVRLGAAASEAGLSGVGFAGVLDRSAVVDPWEAWRAACKAEDLVLSVAVFRQREASAVESVPSPVQVFEPLLRHAPAYRAA